MKICHMSSVHKFSDIRIFRKQCCSLAEAGNEVTFLVQSDRSENISGVSIEALPRVSFRPLRIIILLPYVLYFTVKNRYDVYHAHDPELLPVLFVLHLFGRNVIYDMHENFPKQLMSKKAPRIVKNFIACVWPKIERIILSRIPVVFAESSYKKDYPYIGKYIDVLNMPILTALERVLSQKHNEFSVGYVGGVTENRYCIRILETLIRLQKRGFVVRFDCVGKIQSNNTCMKIEKLLSDLRGVHFHGELPPDEAWAVISKCHVGLAILMPLPNYIDSYPTKMFEYLGMGLPVITSNFELYKPVIRDNDVGYCIDPLNPVALDNVLIELYENPALLKEMQQRAKRVLGYGYSWEGEFRKLLSFYNSIIFR